MAADQILLTERALEESMDEIETAHFHEVILITRRLQRRSLRLPTRSKSTQTGHLYTTAQAGTDPRHFRM